MTERKCSVQNCNRKHKGHGYCQMHLSRKKKWGDINIVGKRPSMPVEQTQYGLLVALVGFHDSTCVKWPYKISKWTGYPLVCRNKIKVNAHRAMLELITDETFDRNMHACHSCNNRWCVNPNHLYWGTAQENANHRVSTGVDSKGTNNAAAKLTENDVRYIRSVPAAYGRITELANQFGVYKSTIKKVRARKTWRHVV
jgi:hypothetical protein